MIQLLAGQGSQADDDQLVAPVDDQRSSRRPRPASSDPPPPVKRPKLESASQQALNETQSIENLLKDSDSVLTLLECPVCVNTMSSPVRQCVNGHCVCNACRVRLSSCPLCRGALSPLPHSWLDTLARKLRIPCMFRENGCKDLLKIPEREVHLLSCRFNVRSCPLTPCPWRGPFSDLRQHATSCHRDRVHRLGGVEKSVVFRHTIGETIIPDDDALVCFESEVFLVQLRFDSIRDQLSVIFRQLTGGRLRVPEHTYDVALSNEDTEQKVAFRNMAIPDTDDVEIVKAAKKCFLVQGWVVRKFADHYGFVTVEYKVSRCCKEERGFFGWLWQKYWGQS